ncbi:MAG: FecR family protein [Gammaproteobacteria bacterium]|nr:FecR family protein [Gammaproteobacteria bacterium]
MLLSTTLWCGAAGAQAPAGQVMFSFGSVTITGADGTTRGAKRGEPIFSGDTVTTVAGRVQIKFTDGSLVSLVPNTVYGIDDYSYAGTVNGSERGFFRLVKGGLRTVTGAIGSGNRENYRLTTPVATIGIRGTWFRALLDQFGRLLVSVGFDPDDPRGLIIANAVGQLELDRGENAVVENVNTPPVRTEQQVVLEVPPPGPIPILLASEDCGNADCEQRIVVGEEPIDFTPPVGPPVLTALVAATTDVATVFPTGVESESFIGVTTIGSPMTTAFGVETDTADFTFATIDINTALQVSDPAALSLVQSFLDGADPLDVSFFSANPAQVAESFTIDNVLTVTRWSGGRILTVDDSLGTLSSEVDDLTGFQSWHFITGPTPGSPLPGPFSGIFTYSFAGGSNSTSESGATIGAGAINGTLVLDAASSIPFVSINMQVQHDFIVYNVNGSVDIFGFVFGNQFGGVMQASGGPHACSFVCPANVDGTFSGAGTPPSHAGVAYIIFDIDPIHGVVGFRESGF